MLVGFRAARSRAAPRPLRRIRVIRRPGRVAPAGRAGLVIVLFFVAMAVTAPVFAPYDPLANDWLAVLQPPSMAHPLGTDELGRDVLSRLL